jgi:PAS domain S-box-containing protein
MRSVYVNWKGKASFSALTYLILYGLAIAIPLVLVLGGLLFRATSLEREQLDLRILQVLDDLVDNLDRDFDRHLTILRTLASSQAFEEEDWPVFYEQAQAGLQGRAYIVLLDSAGRQLVNTYVRYGEQPAMTGDPDTLQRMLETKRPVVSNLFTSLVVKKPVFNISLPVLQDGQVRFILNLGLLPADLATILSGQKLDSEWMTMVWDANGVMVARSRDNARYVGTTVPSRMREQSQRAIIRTANPDGIDVLHTTARSQMSGWSVGVNIPYLLVTQQLQSSLMLWGTAATSAILLAMGLGLLFARLITKPLSIASEAAGNLGRGELFAVAGSHLKEADVFLKTLEATRRELADQTTRLRESEARLAAILDQMPIGVGLMDTDGRWILANPVMKHFVPEMIPSRDGRHIGQWHGFDADGRLLEPIQWPSARALRGETVVPGVELTYTPDDGRKVWTRVAAAPFHNADGKIVGAIAILQDITETRLAEEQFHVAVEAAPNGMVLSNRKGQIVLVNSQVERMFGYSREELVGQNIDLLVPEQFRGRHPADRAIYYAHPSVRLMGTGRDVFARCKNGAVVPVEIGLSPTETAQGTMSLCSIVDITDRKKREESQQLVIRELNHRTKNLLTVVQTVANRSMDEVKTMAEAKHVMNGRLKALSQAYAMLVDAKWVGAPLREIIDRQVAAMSNRISVTGCGIVVVPSTAQQFSMIVHELATNALKYGALSVPDGYISIDGKVNRAGQNGVFSFVWKETGGPPVSLPTRKGFGSVILLDSARLFAELVTADYAPAGLTYELQVALATIEVTGNTGTPPGAR